MTSPERFGRFLVRGILGTGASAIVYEAYDAALDRTVAIKTLRAELLEGDDTDDLQARFRREAQLIAGLRHDNLILVYEFDEEWDPPFIAMELITSPSLTKHVKQGHRFSIEEAVEIITQLLSALAYIHDPSLHRQQGLVHRDVKPANIFWSSGQLLKLADFGVAHIRSSTLTQLGTEVGTPAYMSPEQFLGKVVDGRSDLWSCGVILYELLSGVRMFKGGYDTVRATVLGTGELPNLQGEEVALPVAFSKVVQRALTRDAEERFQSAGQFKLAVEDAYRQHASDETVIRSVPTPENGRTDRVHRHAAGNSDDEPSEQGRLAWYRRRWAVVSFAVSIALVAAALFFLLRSPRPDPDQVARAVAAFGCADVQHAIDRDDVHVSGFMQSQADVRALEAQLKRVSGVKQVIAQLQIRAWPYCELLGIIAPYAKSRLTDAAGMRLRVQDYTGVLKAGDNIVLDMITPGFPAYAYIDYFQLDGNVVHLLPGAGANARMLAANSAKVVPEPYQPLRLEVRSPFGEEMLVMIASRQPLSALVRPEFEPAREYLPFLKQALSAHVKDDVATDYLFILTAARAN